MKKFNIKKFRKLCIKAVTENISENEKEIFEKWLNESKENKIEYEKTVSIWEKSGIYERIELPEKDVEWNKLNEKIEKTPKELFNGKNKTNYNSWLKPAFAGSILLVALVAVLFILKNETTENRLKTITTGIKVHKQIVFPDGSKVLLNSRSTLSFFEKFSGGNREVRLNGEAFFEVTKGRKPFTVVTKNAETTVLGTKFDVLSRGNKTQVFVKEGKVDLKSKKQNSNSVLLLKNQLSVVVKNKKPTAPSLINADYLLGWMKGRMVFNRTPLKEIALELERHYGVPVDVDIDTSKIYTVTGSFKEPDIENVLKMICLTLNLSFEKQHEGYVIKSK